MRVPRQTKMPASTNTRLLADFCRDADLSCNTELRAITLNGLLDYLPMLDQFRRIAACVPEVLSQLGAACLHTVTFVVWVSYGDADVVGGLVDWGAIDRLLAGSRFPALRAVQFAVQGDPAPLARLVRESLPKCDAEGLLRFSYSGAC